MTALMTIGYQRAKLADFVVALKVAGVTTLIDVREVAWSRRREYARKALTETLAAAGIAYVHLKGLGTPKSGRAAAKARDREGFEAIFAAHTKTPEFQSDLAKAADIARGGGACLMCYERDPNNCHRQIVAGLMRDKDGFEIRHIMVGDGGAYAAQGELL
ncbi:MAG: DUF488 domain-containing protein [Rhodospirillales bacterium]|nr:DUF488 domain-containing protein [Rhodospirillales bacterium]